jgi:hypothetical protein
MACDAVVLSERRGGVDISRPVDEHLRHLAAGVGAVAVVVGLTALVVWRPSVIGFPDAALFLLCALAITAGTFCLSFALWGGEWVVSFEAATGTVRQELHTFGNLAVVNGFRFEDLEGLRAVRDRADNGDPAYRLYMVEAENGRPLHVADFPDEDAMRRAARAIAGVHRGLRIG